MRSVKLTVSAKIIIKSRNASCIKSRCFIIMLSFDTSLEFMPLAINYFKKNQATNPGT